MLPAQVSTKMRAREKISSIVMNRKIRPYQIQCVLYIYRPTVGSGPVRVFLFF